MRRFALLLVLGVVTGTAAVAAPTYVPFQTPSGAIGCDYGGSYLRCDVAGGVKPLPPRAKDCSLDWGQGFEMNRTGRATVVCAGDTALGAGTAVPYKTTWHLGGFSCASALTGLQCSNAGGHGFFLSKGLSYRF
jgi:hypothetical protein